MRQARDCGVMDSKVPIYIHAIVKNADHNNFGVGAFPVENYVAALAKFSVPRFYVFGVPANLRLASHQVTHNKANNTIADPDGRKVMFGIA
jgi:hypothetical protein